MKTSVPEAAKIFPGNGALRIRAVTNNPLRRVHDQTQTGIDNNQDGHRSNKVYPRTIESCSTLPVFRISSIRAFQAFRHSSAKV